MKNFKGHTMTQWMDYLLWNNRHFTVSGSMSVTFITKMPVYFPSTNGSLSKQRGR